MNGLTQEMIDAARATKAGQYLDRLIAQDVEQTGGLGLGGSGSIIQQLWDAMKGTAPQRRKPRTKLTYTWVQAALTSSSAQLTVNGALSTTGEVS